MGDRERLRCAPRLIANREVEMEMLRRLTNVEEDGRDALKLDSHCAGLELCTSDTQRGSLDLSSWTMEVVQ
jgi:hypothetical protein